jgi:Flp pilus assembly protein TadB
MLEQAAAGQAHTGERLASELASRRTNRLAEAGKQQLDMVALERSRLDEAMTKATAVVGHEQSARERAEAQVRSLEAAAKLSDRRVIAATVLTALVALVVVAVVVQFWALALGTAIAAVIFGILSRHWARDAKANAGTLFWTAVPEVLVVVDIGVRLGWFGAGFSN